MYAEQPAPAFTLVVNALRVDPGNLTPALALFAPLFVGYNRGAALINAEALVPPTSLVDAVHSTSFSALCATPRLSLIHI